jgi:hypothetical protein
VLRGFEEQRRKRKCQKHIIFSNWSTTKRCILRKKFKLWSQTWWCTPVIPATQETEIGGS